MTGFEHKNIYLEYSFPHKVLGVTKLNSGTPEAINIVSDNTICFDFYNTLGSPATRTLSITAIGY